MKRRGFIQRVAALAGVVAVAPKVVVTAPVGKRSGAKPVIRKAGLQSFSMREMTECTINYPTFGHASWEFTVPHSLSVLGSVAVRDEILVGSQPARVTSIGWSQMGMTIKAVEVTPQPEWTTVK